MPDLGSKEASHTVRPVFSIGCRATGAGRHARHSLASSVGRSLLRDRLGRHDLDAEAGETDIAGLGRGEQADGRDAQVLENLGTKADLAPLALALGFGSGVALLAVLRDRRYRHANRAIAQ